jgi:hypothetical protein
VRRATCSRVVAMPSRRSGATELSDALFGRAIARLPAEAARDADAVRPDLPVADTGRALRFTTPHQLALERQRLWRDGNAVRRKILHGRFDARQ